MKIGMVFHKDPWAPPAGIDLVRLRALARGLNDRGWPTEIVAPVSREGVLPDVAPVKPLRALGRPGRYDLVKASYHFSMELLAEYAGPVICRIVRVVDDTLPERDEGARERLLHCQELIRQRAVALVLNNHENEVRWRRLYGPEPRIAIIPNGCPSVIPAPGPNPYGPDQPAVLFLGSVAAGRMVEMLNHAAERLAGKARVHLVGVNKAALYGAHGDAALHESIICHGERVEHDVWNYIHHARVGLALATGPHPFDNDVTKIISYLRGGLPVLGEEPILNNDLVRQTGYGLTFAHGNAREMAANAVQLIDRAPLAGRESVMTFMAKEHSWQRRVSSYTDLLAMLRADHAL
jgi:hypothetical protein